MGTLCIGINSTNRLDFCIQFQQTITLFCMMPTSLHKNIYTVKNIFHRLLEYIFTRKHYFYFKILIHCFNLPLLLRDNCFKVKTTLFFFQCSTWRLDKIICFDLHCFSIDTFQYCIIIFVNFFTELVTMHNWTKYSSVDSVFFSFGMLATDFIKLSGFFL